MKAITSEETSSPKGTGKTKGKAPALPKGGKGKNKGKKGDRSVTPPPSGTHKGQDGKKGNGKGKTTSMPGKVQESSPTNPKETTPAGVVGANPTPAPQPKGTCGKPESSQSSVHILLLRVDVRKGISVYTYMQWRVDAQNPLFKRMSQDWRPELR